MKPALIVTMVGMIVGGELVRAEGEPPRRYPRPEAERERQRRVEAERVEPGRSARGRELATRSSRPLSTAESRSLEDLIRDAPESRAVRRWGEKLDLFQREFEARGRAPSQAELSEWIRREIPDGAGSELSRSSFRGALREMTLLNSLARSGYTEIRWDREVQKVSAFGSDGRPVELGSRRHDLVAVTPEGRGVRVATEAREIVVESKAADLAKALSKAELEVISAARTEFDLVDHVIRRRQAGSDVSRVFSEVAKDAWLAKHGERAIEWVVNEVPAGFAAAMSRLGIVVHVVQ